MKMSSTHLQRVRRPEGMGILHVYLDPSEVAFLGASKDNPWVELKTSCSILQIQKVDGGGRDPKLRTRTDGPLRKIEFPKRRANPQISIPTHFLEENLTSPVPSTSCTVRAENPRKLITQIPEAFLQKENSALVDKVKEYEALRQAVSIINSAVHSKTARIEVVGGRLVVEAQVKFF